MIISIKLKRKTSKSEDRNSMASAALVQELSQYMTLSHGVQIDRQEFLGRLIENASAKMEALREEADNDAESDQTFQSWLADQVFDSANYLTLQFTEAVMARIWEKIQSFKLDQVKELVRPMGKDAATR